MSASIKEIKAYLKTYRYLDNAARQVQNTLQLYGDLKPGNEQFVFASGHREQLFRLRGTIPVTYQRNVYNIPLVIWLQKTFPQTNPLVYVTPTPEMSINPSRYVDTSGVVYLPYLSDWKDGRSDLATLVQVLCGCFAENVPVYSRRSQGWGPQPPASYQSPSYSPAYHPYGQSQPAYPPAAPYPTTQSSMPTPGGYPSYGNYPQTSGSTPQSYPPSHGNFPAYPQPPAISTPQVMSAEEERKRIQREEEQRMEVKRKSLESAVEHRIKQQLQTIVDNAEVEMSTLKQTQSRLKENNESLSKMMADLDNKQKEVEKGIDILHGKTTELERVLEYLESQPAEVDPDLAVTAVNPVHNQILRLYAEENAIDDTIYYLGEALRKGIISHEAFLKYVRDLSREQFIARATIMKARDAAKLPPHGVSA